MSFPSVPDLSYIFHHVFLPPKLPQADDDGVANDNILASLMVKCAVEFEHAAEQNGYALNGSWSSVQNILRSLNVMTKQVRPTRVHFERQISSMQPGDVLPMLIRAQNAAIIIRNTETKAVFEVFEVTAPNEVIMACEGKLLSSFPSNAISVPHGVFHHPHFQLNLSNYLYHMDVDELDESSAHTTKAGSSVVESRDSPDPKFITDLLLVILAATHDDPVIRDPTRRITKRIADDVMWNNALDPWRRSKLWLVLRVALQTTLEPTLYKAFMAFSLACVLEHALAADSDDDMLWFMKVKCSRRSVKLPAYNAPNFVSLRIHDACQRAELFIRERRKKALSTLDHGHTDWNPSALNFDEDTALRLQTSRPIIQSILDRTNPPTPDDGDFQPNQKSRMKHSQDFADILEQASTSFEGETMLKLIDFESAVRKDLATWTTTHHNTKSQSLLLKVIHSYYSAANEAYAGNAENQSLMILTVLSLWKSMDEIAVAQCPMIKDYPPEVTVDLLEQLLVLHEEDIERITDLAVYLHGREMAVKYPYASVFQQGFSETSFAVRYFDSSSALQDILREIEEDATEERQRKCEELRSEQQTHRDLTRRFERLAHDHTTRYNLRGRSWVDKSDCESCRLRDQAHSMTIEVHEWPLPSDVVSSKGVVFELHCPEVFSLWRKATYVILHDLFISEKQQSESADISTTLDKYFSMRNICHTESSGISLASEIKSFVNTHYSHQRVASISRSEDICVPSGLRWQLFSTSHELWVTPASCRSTDISSRCNLPLPGHAMYLGMDQYVYSTSHSTNEVLVLQSKCSQDLSLHEFLAFATLRAGGTMQWMNIARELAANNLTFNQKSVYILIAQAVQQAGLLSTSGELTWHKDLEVQSFNKSLLKELDRLRSTIAGNWQEIPTLKAIILIIIRLLGASPHSASHEDAYNLLQSVRETAYGWLQALLNTKEAAVEESQVEYIKARIRDAAATCVMTFDVDAAHIDLVLDAHKDLQVLLHCGIILNDNRASASEPLSRTDATVRTVMDRSFRVFVRLETHIWDRVQVNPTGIDGAVFAAWSTFQRDETSIWSQLGKFDERWITCQTSTDQEVHLNLLSGILLVDRKPVGTLPIKVTEHATYQRLFGKIMPLVTRADKPDMDYQFSPAGGAYQVYLSLREDKLTVQAKSMVDGTLGQYLPMQHFRSDLPSSLVDGYSHWVNWDTKHVEFRPLDSTWKAGEGAYCLEFETVPTKASKLYDLDDVQNRKVLIEPSSRTFGMLSDPLQRIESRAHINMFVQPSSKRDSHPILIQLPRMGLDFRLNMRCLDLECLNISGAVVDINQSIGALHGLKSKLVLCNRQDTLASSQTKTSPVSRAVLLPQGVVGFSQRDHHVAVNIDAGEQLRVGYRVYAVDPILGRLTDDGTLESRLYKIYLFALTSHLLPDELTGRTGTQEALTELNSARCLSFMCLNDGEHNLLRLLRNLSPSRHFYPIHLEVMQTADWLEMLPASSQSQEFEYAISRILDYESKLSVFNSHGDLSKVDSMVRSSAKLLSRAYTRELASRPIFLSTQAGHVQSTDAVYYSRAQTLQEPLDHYQVARAAFVGSSGLCDYQMQHSLYAQLKKLGRLSGNSNASGKPSAHLSYSRDWLKPSDLSTAWFKLYNGSRDDSLAQDGKRFQLMFTLAALAYSSFNEKAIQQIAQILAFSFSPVLRTQAYDPPQWSVYNFVEFSDAPNERNLASVIASCQGERSDTPSWTIPRRHNEEYEAWNDRRNERYRSEVDVQASAYTAALLSQWPCRTPDSPAGRFDHLIMSDALQQAREMFEQCFHNRCLRIFAENVQGVIGSITVPNATPTLTVISTPTRNTRDISRSSQFYSFGHKRAPDLQVITNAQVSGIPTGLRHPGGLSQVPYQPESANRLSHLVSVFGHDASLLAREYGREVKDSLANLRWPKISVVDEYSIHCQASFSWTLQAIHSALAPQHIIEMSAERAGSMLPRLSVKDILSFMTFRHWTTISAAWKTALVVFGIAMVRLQQSRRLQRLARQGEDKSRDILREIDNLAHFADAVTLYLKHPDWLLVQIESDFHMRDLQARVALEMFSPSSKSNSALQLNMGEGKSSVIIPMVSASLANGKNLVRVIILKSLVPQMFQLLITRLGSLCNRRIFFLPFSRQMDMNVGTLKQIKGLYLECIRVQGVLVAQPEHILSAKLLSVEQMLPSVSERAVSDSDNLGPAALEIQRLLAKHSRDILDESDELLHVRYQLIYTMGKEKAMDGGSDRWRLIQSTLLLAMKHAEALSTTAAEMINVQRDEVWAFPHIRFSPGDDVDTWKKRLFDAIVNDIASEGLPGLSVAYLSNCVKTKLRRVLSEKSITPKDKACLCEAISATEWTAVLVLRGILAYDTLLYALCERRWRVDYGLDRSRSLLAVPYRAKDVPATRAEFGHPEVAILLTCLAYYYHGLTPTEVATAIRGLLKSTNPDAGYQEWISCIPPHAVDPSLVSITGINLEDRAQHSELVAPLFSKNRATIDFYLRDHVFPKAAKEFPHKLSTSGWDLAEHKNHVTTGFSGTNDNRYLLPSSITQVDPVNQSATNALVLTYLLNPENAEYQCSASATSNTLSGKEFVQLTVQKDSSISVLLDVGAQILDLTNRELCEYWLSVQNRKEACIFFDDNDELTILTRDGRQESFLTSPFRHQTDKCLVYLDDAHTRGTDLKLPLNARAAVTLGRKVTKDRLVQGCMRLRQLGHGQSLMFFAPFEIDAAIRKACGKSSNAHVEVEDILLWSMEETLADIHHHLPVWASQGADYQRRREAIDAVPEVPTAESSRNLEEVWLQREARSLAERYDTTMHQQSSNESSGSFPAEVSARLEGFGMTGSLDQGIDEEQEREVGLEVEEERQNYRPPPAVAATPSVHQDVKHFVATGERLHSSAFVSLSQVLRHVPFWSAHSSNKVFNDSLVTTADFGKVLGTDPTDADAGAAEYLSLVRWILTCTTEGRKNVVIISQFEAHSLIEAIRSSKHVHLHVYTPRTTKSMRVFDDLQFYSVPPLPEGYTGLSLLKPLITQLNVFAGQLYPANHEDYLAFCDFLGIDARRGSGQDAESDGFVPMQKRIGGSTSPFTSSPVPFLKALMNLRRKQQDFDLTPVGKLLTGRARAVEATDL